MLASCFCACSGVASISVRFRVTFGSIRDVLWIFPVCRRFAKPYGIKVCAAFGGLNKYDQFKELKAGAEVAVCTPGRMIDLIKMKACNTLRVTFLVFDEADRMFDMGFEPQVRNVPLPGHLDSGAVLLLTLPC